MSEFKEGDRVCLLGLPTSSSPEAEATQGEWFRQVHCVEEVRPATETVRIKGHWFPFTRVGTVHEDYDTLVSAARETHVSDDLEIDADPLLSEADEGTWVAAWVWVLYADALEAQEGDDAE